ncbi:MAG: DUF481 domain-containing protein [Luteimonas sp.]
MLTASWLTLVGLSVFLQPLPDAPNETAAVAIATGQVSLRTPCFSLVCPDAEWLPPTRYTQLQRPIVPGALPHLRPSRPSPLATRSYTHLNSPANRRTWVANDGSDWRIDTRYGVEAIRTPETNLRFEVATGYRLQPYVDYGTDAVGPIARGGVTLSQNIGERTRLTQQVQIETGRRNTFVRQTIGVDLTLRPQWTLRSDIETHHDTAADDGNGATDTEGSVKVHYAF